MDPFSNKKKGDSYKNGSMDDKLDLLDNGSNSIYYSHQTTPSEKMRTDINSRQDQRDNNNKSGILVNNDTLLNSSTFNNTYNIVNSSSLLNNENNTNNNGSINPNMLNSNNPNNTFGNIDENGNICNTSHYRYTPTINMDVVKTPVAATQTTTNAAAGAAAAAEEENEKVTKIRVRGWKLNYNVMKALTISVNACPTITDLT